MVVRARNNACTDRGADKKATADSRKSRIVEARRTKAAHTKRAKAAKKATGTEEAPGVEKATGEEAVGAVEAVFVVATVEEDNSLDQGLDIKAANKHKGWTTSTHTSTYIA